MRIVVTKDATPLTHKRNSIFKCKPLTISDPREQDKNVKHKHNYFALFNKFIETPSQMLIFIDRNQIK